MIPAECLLRVRLGTNNKASDYSSLALLLEQTLTRKQAYFLAVRSLGFLWPDNEPTSTVTQTTGALVRDAEAKHTKGMHDDVLLRSQARKLQSLRRDSAVVLKTAARHHAN